MVCDPKNRGFLDEKQLVLMKWEFLSSREKVLNLPLNISFLDDIVPQVCYIHHTISACHH